MLFRQRLLNDWLFGCYFEGDGGGGSGSDPGKKADPPGGGEPQTFSADYVTALRGESANYRTRAKAAEDEVKTLKASSETSAAELKKAQEAATAANARVVKAEVKVAAAKAGIVDPDTAYLLIKDAVKLNDAGDPENVEALLEQLAKDKPYLVGQGGSGGGGGNADPGRGREQGGQITKEAAIALAKSDVAEFNRRFEKGDFKHLSF